MLDAADEAQLLDAIDQWIERELKPIVESTTTPIAIRPTSSSR